MPWSIPRSLGALAALTLALGACEREPAGPGQDTHSEADSQLGVVADPSSLGPLFSETTADGSRDCTYSDDTGRFTCPVVTRDGLTITRSYALLDAGGNSQSAYDAATTASINFQHTVSGTVTRADGSAAVNRESDLTVSGLEGDETTRIWNGTGAGRITAQRTGPRGTREVVTTVGDTTTNVVIAVPRSEDSWPLSGTQVHSAASTVTSGDFSRARSRRSVVTFNGTSIVPVEITTELGTRSCTRDLETRRLSC